MSGEVADTVATEEVVAPETTEAVETTEEVAAVEETLLAGKYKTPEDLEKGYTEMQSLYNTRYKGFTGAPESGEYTAVPIDGIAQDDIDFISNSSVFQRFKENGIKNGMSNDMFSEVVNDYITAQREETQASVDREMGLLGDDAKVRIDNVVAKLGTILKEDQLEGLKGSLSSAASIEALETILGRDVNTIAPPDLEVDSADKEAELNDLWNAKDGKGRRIMEYDADYRKTVNKKWKDYYGE